MRFQGVEELAGGNHCGLAGEHFVYKAGMNLRVGIGAAVFYHDKTVVRVSGVAQRRKNHPAGCNPEQDQCVDIVGSQNHFKVSTRESAHAMLGDDNIVSLGSNSSMNRAARSLQTSVDA